MDPTTDEQFNKWLSEPEGLHIEFKKAKSDFSKNELKDYCAALANEGGGKLILGVTDDRKISGSNAFCGTTDQLSNEILSGLGVRVDVEEKKFAGKRTLIFHIPSRMRGRVIKSNGRYLMRAGSSLVEASDDWLSLVFSENEPDFSAKIVPGLSVDDIDESAVIVFKNLWARRQKNTDYLKFSTEKMLRAIGAMDDDGINYAGLILFGKKRKIDNLLPGAEIIFEWRQEKKIPHDSRQEWRGPFFLIFNDIWVAINARNIRFSFQDGFIQREVFAFNEETIREALLNAVAHRDYAIGSASIFIKAYPDDLYIQSPGGFPHGIDTSNILHKSLWRNRRIAEILQIVGLVERAGQGMDKIFGNTISEGKGMPDFSGSDKFTVSLHIPAKVKDEQFILFLEKLANGKQVSLSFEEIYELEDIRDKKQVKDVKSHEKFLDLGIIEKLGNTSGISYILSHKYYTYKGKTGVHTRIVGLTRDEKKELILKHIRKNGKGYAKDFKDAFPELRQGDISNLLRELKIQGKILHKGSDRHGYWECV